MTSQLARLYALVVGVLVFFVVWAAVAAHPWASRPAQDPRLAALAARQQLVQVESLRVKRLVDARWALYRRQLAAHNVAVARQAATQQVAAQQAAAQAVAAQPSVRVVNLPPLVVTRTS
jgi:hypothetical protein